MIFNCCLHRTRKTETTNWDFNKFYRMMSQHLFTHQINKFCQKQEKSRNHLKFYSFWTDPKMSPETWTLCHQNGICRGILYFVSDIFEETKGIAVSRLHVNLTQIALQYCDIVWKERKVNNFFFSCRLYAWRTNSKQGLHFTWHWNTVFWVKIVCVATYFSPFRVISVYWLFKSCHIEQYDSSPVHPADQFKMLLPKSLNNIALWKT